MRQLSLYDLQTRPPSRLRSGIRAASSHNDAAFVANLDRIAVLGDTAGRQSQNDSPYGHTGCVNALSWSASGSLLASGSDDFRICLWKLGQGTGIGDHSSPPSDLQLGLALNTTINTGHTRNIFSVKFAPHSAESRLLSCAGDGRVKVFDLNRSAAEPAKNGSRSWDQYSDSSCVRTFRCHKDRVKRISLEDSPDVFLTCSEDGTVRQHDLRINHSCTVRSSCPPPIAAYRGLALYSLSISKSRPELFACGGTSPFAFLHDRRMFRQTIKSKWGLELGDGLSQCVRRFSLDHDTASSMHIFACKLGDNDASQLLVSYSEGPVALFDIHADTVRPEDRSRVKRSRTISPAADTPDTERVMDEDDAEESRSTDEDEPKAKGEKRSTADEDTTEKPSNIPLCLPTRRFTGHQNTETVKDVNFGFAEDRFVMSGSDDGRLFIFDRNTAEIVNILEGDKDVVNVMTTHPRLPVLAVSGIDSSVKIFAPTSTQPRRYSALADKEQIVKRNTAVQSRQRRAVPMTSALLQLLSQRIVATQGEDSDEETDQPTLRITSAEIAQLLAGREEQGDGDGNDCRVS